jgi:hypothetical protein
MHMCQLCCKTLAHSRTLPPGDTCMHASPFPSPIPTL